MPHVSAQPQPSLQPSLLPDWRLTAEKVQHEMDSAKLIKLVDQLLRELEEARGRAGTRRALSSENNFVENKALVVVFEQILMGGDRQ
jgi:hypothetical protein